ncbi:glycosyltransferase family 39 protein [Rathayibacter soli]|uniref:glycosyltransferase family 39 protein n=1 Tax=Rathayibacter soli TaxID=3144168 RepID=UPI0027E3EAAF|nr:glycosyltransferase family 39 protein [Glaciibacter superstes]
MKLNARSVGLPRVAWLPVGAALVTVGGALAFTIGQYGYHRDELYFRMLPLQWGYTDQPPLTPFIANLMSTLADQVSALRIPALIFALVSTVIVALIAREVGGGAGAQALAAWGYAFGALTLVGGHVLLTASFDLMVWPAVMLAIIRAQLRGKPVWWLVAGAIAGISMYNKLLIAFLLVALLVGIVAVGPRSLFRSPWLYGAVGVMLVIGSPNLIYQAVNGWPQLSVGAALASDNGGNVRVLLLPYLALLLGPTLVPFWIAGLVAVFRRPGWRAIRFIGVAFPVLVLLVFVAGSQFYYPFGLESVVFAIGCVPVAEFARRSRVRAAAVVTAVALNVIVVSVISLPLIPVTLVGATPIPAINQTQRDQVGWPRYVHQVDAVAASVAQGDVVVLASNYGEAGALERYGSRGQPPVYSGHNALWDLGPPPQTTTTVVVVGGQYDSVKPFFSTCAVRGHLDNGVGVDNEEQGQPIAVCNGPKLSWSNLWPKLRHLG